MSDSALVKLKNIAVTFNKRQVLSNISLDIYPNQIITLIGPSGSGKSTLVRVILGLQSADVGKRKLQKNLCIGYMPQTLQLNANMPLTVNRFLSLTKSTHKEIMTALNRTGIAYAENQDIHSLSGGEKQRVLLARAILHQPDFLVLDEPVQGVDISGQKDLYKLITMIRDEQKCGILIVSHDLHLVMSSTDIVYCLNNHICCSGHPEKVQQHPAYLSLLGVDSNLAVYAHHHNHKHDVDGDIIPAKHPPPRI